VSDLPSRRTTLIGGALGAVAALASSVPALAQDEPKGLRVIAELIAKPGSADDLRMQLLPFAQGARTEPGCLRYTLLEIQGDPGHFMTYEVWTNRAALDAHMKTPALTALGPKLSAMLAKPFTQLFLDALT
jgi:quinol monooxygenase YgiN